MFDEGLEGVSIGCRMSATSLRRVCQLSIEPRKADRIPKDMLRGLKAIGRFSSETGCVARGRGCFEVWV
jgi:hypothetical protein